MIKTYWNYIDNYGSLIDIEMDSAELAENHAQNILNEDCINEGVGYEMIEIKLQEFFFDNDNKPVVLRLKPCIIIYDSIKNEMPETYEGI